MARKKAKTALEALRNPKVDRLGNPKKKPAKKRGGAKTRKPAKNRTTLEALRDPKVDRYGNPKKGRTAKKRGG